MKGLYKELFSEENSEMAVAVSDGKEFACKKLVRNI